MRDSSDDGQRADAVTDRETASSRRRCGRASCNVARRVRGTRCAWMRADRRSSDRLKPVPDRLKPVLHALTRIVVRQPVCCRLRPRGRAGQAEACPARAEARATRP